MSLSLGKQHLQLSVSFLLSYSVFNEQLPRLSPHGGDDGIRLSRELRAQSFAALTIINRHSLPLLLRIPSEVFGTFVPWWR